MNLRPFVQRNVLPIILLVFVSIALIAWGGQTQTSPQTTKQAFTDTVPKKKTDKKIRDLDEAIEDLDKVDLKVDLEKVTSQIEDAMKQIDMAKVQMEVDKAMKAVDMEKMKDEIERATREIDAAKIERDVKESLDKIDWKKMEKDLEEVKKIDMSKLNEDMKKLDLQMKELGPKIEKEMEKAKVEIEKAKEEMKEYKAFVDGLDHDGLINKKEPYSIEHKNGELIINGKKQPANVYDKYRSFLQKHKTFNIKKSDDDFNIDNNNDH
ncbi:MAG: hypothetical protein E6H10_02805 [Bacteroidetes bacterium]|nr:MAG: hypothetical protein E6H10_02805 [Bacteroidota bacterium]